MLIGLVSSCEDAYNIEQPGQVSPEETYASLDGLNKNLISLYGDVSYENGIAFTSIFTDEVGIGIANGGQGLNDGSWGYVLTNSSSYANSIWYSNYAAISAANRVIEYSKNTKFDPATEGEQFNNIIAHARAIRAFSYFQLLSYFSTDMSDPNALGVMLFTDVRDIKSPGLPRVSNSEVFALIDSDLAFAASNITLSDVPVSSANPIFINPYFIDALKARMALYRKDYTTAKTLAQSLIDLFPLSTKNDYAGLWQDANNIEVIFKLERSINDNRIGNIWTNTRADNRGSHFYEMGRSLFNNLGGTTDMRRRVFVGSTSRIDPNYQNSANYRSSDLLYINKYFGSEGTFLLNDVKVFRSSEMYFIKAECQIAEGDLTGAATTLRELRNVRKFSGTAPLPNYLDAKAAWADVLFERRIELCYEGHRYIDMKRLGKLAGKSFERDTKDCEINNSCFFGDADWYKLTMPIPSSELNANVVIRGQQNPNY